MADIDIAATIQRAMDDPEFSRETRFFDGAMKIAVDAKETVVRFRDGRLISAAVTEVPDSDCKIIIRGTEEHWEKMLARYPVPFYQCLQTTSVKHGLQLSTTNETFAYLPALNRLIQILRSERNEAS